MQQPANANSHTSRNNFNICDPDNPLSFGLKFTQNAEGAISTTFTGNSTLQGYTGIIHGGLLSAMLDAAMAQCLLHQDVEGVTGELNVRYLKQIDCRETMVITAWIDSSLPPLYHLRADIRVRDRVVCKAKARFMRRLP